MATTTNLTTLKLNYLTQAQYDTAISNNTINADELYFTPAGNITLNGTINSSPTFYAPTTSGTATIQALISGGTNTAPTWANIAPSITIGAGTSSAAPTVNVTVLGQTGTAQAITTASTSVYGVTKFSDIILDASQITSGILTTVRGGTGNSSYTTLRAVYTATATQMASSSHYMSSTKLGVNSTSEPAGALYVNGNSVFNGTATVNNILTLYRESTTNNNEPSGLTFTTKDTTTGQTYSGIIRAYNDHASTSYGLNFVISPRGNLFIGSGEAAENHYALYTSSATENVFLTADGTVNIQSNGNTIANRHGFAVLETPFAIVPIQADACGSDIGSIGTDTYKWNAMYATTFHGDLDGYSNNNIIVDDSAPTGDERTLWIDTSQGDNYAILKYWNGTNWITVKSVWA